MSESQKLPPEPRPVLAVVLVALISRSHPEWLAVPLKQAAHDTGLSAERVSRLATKALPFFETTMARLTRRGRPKAEIASDDLELRLTKALLDVASSILLRLARSQRKLVRELVVGAWMRLSADFASLTRERFSAALGIPVRTLHDWLERPRAPANPAPSGVGPPKPPKPRKRSPRRGRFRFDVLLPGTQVASDTTDASAFGVGLKIVGAQDLGGRDQDLLASVVVDERENADRVVQVLDAVLKPGMQAITDQGTPYMAELTKAALDAKGVEHAPQREGDPLGKSTLERAWRTLKDIGAPLLGLTDRLAEKLPALRTPELAIPFMRVLVAVQLRSYQAGARATRAAIAQRGNIDPVELARLAEESRDRAIATEKSVRLFLEHIHTLYQLEGTTQTFVRSLKRYPLEVLKEAEVLLRESIANLRLNPLHSPARFYASRVRAAHAAFRARQVAAERDRRREEADRDAARAREARAARTHADPVRGLREALQLVARCWSAPLGVILCPDSLLHEPLARLREIHPEATAIDIARAVLRDFTTIHIDKIGLHAMAAVEEKFERILSVVVSSSNNPRISPIRINTAQQQRPSPDSYLRI